MSKKIFILSLITTLSFVFPTQAADFNPNHIITDNDLQDYQSMGRAEIRVFLRNKNSSLTDLIIEDFEGKRRYASEIIYQASNNYKINPKYLLVKLQKEQSLVTSPAPTQRQLDWAAGYGACDSCDTTDPNLTKYKGFGKQVDGAAGIMRWYYENSGAEQWIKKANQNYIIDNTVVTPANQATAFLYTYTPHLQGNANFAKLWDKWFSAVYPNGSLIKTQTSSTVYAIINGQKRPIKSMGVLKSRFNIRQLLTVPEADLINYETGAPINFPNYSLLKINDTIYLLDNEEARPFDSIAVFRQFGYNPAEIEDATAADLVGYTITNPITLADLFPTGRLVTMADSLYYLKNGNYYYIPDPQIATIRFPDLKPQKIIASELEKFTAEGALLFPDGTIIGSTLTKKIFVIEKKKKRLISTEKILQNLGYRPNTVVWVNDLILDQYQTGEPWYIQEGSLSEAITTTPKNLELSAVKKITPKKTESTYIYYNPPTTTEPIIFTETGKTYLTDPKKNQFAGKKFNTTIDSYIVAVKNKSGYRVNASKNATIPRPMASLTKVLTGFTLFNNNLDLEKEVTYNPARHKTRYGYLYPIAEGDMVKNKDLLHALLVSSFNSPARMLVDSLEKSDVDFVTELNTQAANWNLHQTYFFDAHGVDVRNQTTASEYLTLFATAIKNPTLTTYLATPRYEYEEIIDTNNSAIHRDINSNRLFFTVDKPYEILASKTGYLTEAGYNMAMHIRRNSDGQEFIVITLGNPNYSTKYSETDRLTRWALANF